jgi:hypothetical protein
MLNHAWGHLQHSHHMPVKAPGPIQLALVINDYILEAWPGKRSEDLAVADVALPGHSYSEAVSCPWRSRVKMI